MSEIAKMKVGPLGEAIVERYLREKGLAILERNFRKPWGEIDIIAKSNSGIHFVEVKCARKSQDTLMQYRPEENAHQWKLQKVARTAEGYLLERHIPDTPWQMDVAAIVLDEVRKVANIRYIERVSLE